MINDQLIMMVLLELAQAGFSGLVFVVLLLMYRNFANKYYLYWVLGWGCVAIQHLISCSLLLALDSSGTSVLTALNLMASYVQILLLYVGFYELSFRRIFSRTIFRYLLIVSVVAAVGSVVMSRSSVFSFQFNDFIVFGLRELVFAIFFVFSALLSLRFGLRKKSMKFVVLSFLGYGLIRMYHLVYWVFQTLLSTDIPISFPLLSVFDFVFMAMLGLSTIMAVLEFESRQLQKRNLQLDTFLYRVSFDLKAPLKTMNKLLFAMTEKSIGERAQHKKALISEVNKADDAIKEIIHLRERQDQQVDLGLIDLDLLVRDVLEDLKSTETGLSKVELDINIPSGSSIRSDEKRLKVVLLQILSNAVKFNDAKTNNPKIRLRSKKVALGFEMKINDNGPGIEKSKLSHLFEMFYKVDVNSEGSGLGLYAVKEILEKISGEIQIDSKIGVGTEVTIFVKNLKKLPVKS